MSPALHAAKRLTAPGQVSKAATQAELLYFGNFLTLECYG